MQTTMPAYYAGKPGLTGFLLKRTKQKLTTCGGLINLLFGVSVNNTLGHFTHCSLRIVKYPRVLVISIRNRFAQIYLKIQWHN